MKRKLEAELISIAHRILKLKNKSELAQLQQETLKLYEKISVLRFVEENFSEVKPTIGYAAAEKEVEAIFEKEDDAADQIAAEPKDEVVDAEVSENQSSDVVSEDETPTAAIDEDLETEENLESLDEEEKETEEEELIDDQFETTESEDEDAPAEVETIEEAVEETIEEPEPEVEFAPLFEIAKEEAPVKSKQITLEDFLSEGHVEPIFVRAEEVYSNEKTTTQTNPETHSETVTKVEVVETKKTQFIVDHHEPKTVSLNDSLSKSINIGLNDRIGFEKHLFGGSGEDLNRVLSQLSTYSNFGEAQEFIEDMVKPDYNNWAGKEDYETRFMELVEKKFS